MNRSTRDRERNGTNAQWPATEFLAHKAKIFGIFLLVSMLALSACGGGSGNSSPSQSNSPIVGNWQFTMTNPPDNSSVGGLQGGFLLQTSGLVTGAAVYSVALPQAQAAPIVCNSGSAPITGTVNGQQVAITAAAGPQTFTLTGAISDDGSTMAGSYSTNDGKGCGTIQSGLQWSAVFVKPVTGTVQGSFHSVNGAAIGLDGESISLSGQDFQVTGSLTQGQNIGASNATVTGALTFVGYPCLVTASVSGQISGNSVILQLFGTNGLNAGQIGAPVGFQNPSPVVVESASGGGIVVHGANGYGVNTKSCPGGNLPGDIGNICLALGGATSCSQQVLLSPVSIAFPAQQLGSFPQSQTITLTNTDPSGTTLNGLSLSFQAQAGAQSPFGLSDFTGLPNFTEHDTCAASLGSTFSLDSQKSCSITVSFAPQESCPWLPLASLGGISPGKCPFPLAAKLTVNGTNSLDGDAPFSVPISGIGLSAIVPSTPELVFGSQALGESSLPQTVSFTNQGALPVEILPAMSSPCVNPDNGILQLPRPLIPGGVGGLQVLTNVITPDSSTIDYVCDSDLTSKQPNFQISSDSCSGKTLNPQGTCSVQVTLVPQPSTSFVGPLDYFLELDTLQCTSNTTLNCEIDSGRFPVELKANSASPLRMSPGAGLDFGLQLRGQPIELLPTMKITLFNDPSDPNAGTVNFTGNLVVGDYTEVDDCGASLDPGGTCTLTVTFNPKIVGFDPGTITIAYTVGQTQTVYLRGTGQ